MRDLVLSSIPKLDNLIQKVVVLIVDLVAREEANSYQHNYPGAWSSKNERHVGNRTYVIPVMASWIEMNSSERIELLKSGLLMGGGGLPRDLGVGLRVHAT